MSETRKALQLDTTDPLDQRIIDGVELDEQITEHKRNIARDRAHRKSKRNRLLTISAAAAVGIPLGVLYGNSVLDNHENHQKQVSDVPGQQYLKQEIANGSIDSSQAVHLRNGQ